MTNDTIDNYMNTMQLQAKKATVTDFFANDASRHDIKLRKLSWGFHGSPPTALLNFNILCILSNLLLFLYAIAYEIYNTVYS